MVIGEFEEFRTRVVRDRQLLKQRHSAHYVRDHTVFLQHCA
jgi:hypothetical protein